jgi:hypothetical protein
MKLTAMRRVRLALLSLITTVSAVLLSQPQSESPLVVKIKYVKIDLPRSTTNTCLVVFADGKFHLEEGSDFPPSKPQVFEDSLTQDSLNSLTTILAANDLKSLQTVSSEEQKIAQGEIVWVHIPRGETLQKLIFAGLEASATQRARKLPAALEPLLNWFHATVKGAKQQKLRPLRNAKPTHCGL